MLRMVQISIEHGELNKRDSQSMLSKNAKPTLRGSLYILWKPHFSYYCNILESLLDYEASQVKY